MRFVIFFLLFFSVGFAEPTCDKIFQYIAKNLPLSGTLHMDSDNFVYVDVDDDYIHKLVEFIKADGFEEPPYFGGPNMHGAHITVMYPKEVKDYGIKQIEEEGMKIFFDLKSCKTVRPPNWPDIEWVYFITVDAPTLTKIRQKYGLPQREYEFHITIGVKRCQLKAA